LRLADKYGDARVTESCTLALHADMLDLRRLERMLQLPPVASLAPAMAKVIPIARYLRPPVQYALPFAPKPEDPEPKEEEPT